MADFSGIFGGLNPDSLERLAMGFRPKGTTISDIMELDACVSQSHTSKVDVTDNPVENGSDVTDHFRVKPDQLTLDGILSNTPLSTYQNLKALAGDAVALANAVKTLRFSITQQQDVMESSYRKLLALLASGNLITVTTRIRTYKNMKMTDLTVPRDATTGEVLRFTASFREIRLVSTQEVSIVLSGPPPIAHRGAQPTTTTPPATRSQSILSGWGDSSGLTNGVKNLLRVK